MSQRALVLCAIGLGVLAFAGASHAQPKEPTPDVLPPAPAEKTEKGPSDGASADSKSTGNVGGYAYSDKPTHSTSHARYRSRGPVVNMPGFEQTADGGSRLFVQLSQSVPVEERKAQGSITYILKGASPRVWNNTNALVTVHFNTPVSRARLVPAGQDLHFIVELRAAATPTWKMNESQDKTAMLAIDFGKGDFSQAPATETGAAATPAAPRPPKAARGGKRKGPAPAPANAPKP